jgi:FKBP-type peptidyl-prolyl cis-trans isomerase SlyD
MSTNVISFHYTLTDAAGTVLDNSRGAEPLSFLAGHSQIIPGLETALLEMKKGDKKKVHVAAKDAYGEKEEDRMMNVPRTQFPKDLDVKIGDRFRPDANDPHAPVFVVTAVNEKEVTLDGNHPLAGKDLNFDVELVDIRKATEEEQAHGHVHGPGGHHHH